MQKALAVGVALSVLFASGDVLSQKIDGERYVITETYFAKYKKTSWIASTEILDRLNNQIIYCNVVFSYAEVTFPNQKESCIAWNLNLPRAAVLSIIPKTFRHNLDTANNSSSIMPKNYVWWWSATDQGKIYFCFRTDFEGPKKYSSISCTAEITPVVRE